MDWELRFLIGSGEANVRTPKRGIVLYTQQYPVPLLARPRLIYTISRLERSKLHARARAEPRIKYFINEQRGISYPYR